VSGAALSERLAAAVAALGARLPAGSAPTVGLVLGSGLGAFADGLDGRVAVPFGDLPGFAVSTVPGHAGQVVFGRAAGVPLLALSGRLHHYEGHDLATVVHPVRTLIAAGCTTLIVTNAAGGIAPDLSPGQLVLIADHLNLLGDSPLRGANDPRVGPRFPDLTLAYDPALRRLAQAAALELGLTLREGVYAGLGGPAYETPAEVRMLRGLGADLVGMSTVAEVIAARHMGARVLGVSLVTNLAAGLSPSLLSHDEVTAAAAAARATFSALLHGVLGRLAAAPAADPGDDR